MMQLKHRSMGVMVVGFALLSSVALATDPPPNCAGSEIYRFKVEASADDGYSWSGGTLNVYAKPNNTIYIRLRTLMTITSGQTQGWSLGLQHTNSWTAYYGGAVSLSSVTTTGTGTATVQNGSAPDYNHLQIRSGFRGYTQAVGIDNDSGYTISPVTSFVTSKACLAITAPPYANTYPIDLKFSHQVGIPPVHCTVSQGGVSKSVCAYNMVLNLNVNHSYTNTIGTCGYYGAAPQPGGGEEQPPKEEEQDESIKVPTIPSKEVSYQIRSEQIENEREFKGVAYSTVIDIPNATWMQLQFASVNLSGRIGDGSESVIRLTSLHDGDSASMNMDDLLAWRFRTPFFNGNAVLLELISAPKTGASEFSIEVITVGVPMKDHADGGGANICSTSDERVPANSTAIGRLSPLPCTAWIVTNDTCLLSAGHCFATTTPTAVEFNVPLSNPVTGDIVRSAAADTFPIDVNSIQFQSLGEGNDWAYFGCNRNQTSQLLPFEQYGQSITIAATIPDVTQQTMRTTGYGCDVNATPPCFTPGPNLDRNHTQQTDTGPFEVHVGTSLAYDIDSMFGSSGGPVLIDQFGTSIGIHTKVSCDTQGDTLSSGTAIDHPSLVAAMAAPTGVCMQVSFRRGDTNSSGAVDISDGVHELTFLFQGGTAPSCLETGDINDDGVLDITDPIFLLLHLFNSGPAPPFPGISVCGKDRAVTPFAVGCISYPPCQ